MVTDLIRKRISRHFTRQREIALKNNIPSYQQLQDKFNSTDELGIYLHIPFCDQICPYCPYNKEIFSEEACFEYKNAVIREIDNYLPIVSDKPVTSFYIGGSAHR